MIHAVRSNGFAGVERYVCDVTNELLRRDWEVIVVGGDPARMQAELSGRATWVAARTTPALALALSRRRADVVHAHMTAADLAAAAVTRPGTVLASTRHFTTPRGSSAPVRAALRWAMRRYAVRLAISEYVASTDPGSGERVLLNGVPEHDLVPLDARSRTVAVVQRHEAEKQTDLALRAWAASRLPSAGWRLILAGQGSTTPALRRLTNGLGIASSVDVVGFVPAALHLMSTSGALLATAPCEPFGLAVVEAMATGTPVIAAGAGGHLETLGSAGWTFPPGDTASCAAALNRLLNSPCDVATYGRSLWDRQRQRLSVGRHVDALEGHYRQALATKRRAVT